MSDELPGAPSPYTDGARLGRADAFARAWEARGYMLDESWEPVINWDGAAFVEARPVPKTAVIPPGLSVTLADEWERRANAMDVATMLGTPNDITAAYARHGALMECAAELRALAAEASS